MRKTVTVSYSCDPEIYQKLVDLKEALESERMDKVSMSGLINKLIKLGFARREELREKQIQTKQKELMIGQTDFKEKVW